jgi:hypothetical protein
MVTGLLDAYRVFDLSTEYKFFKITIWKQESIMFNEQYTELVVILDLESYLVKHKHSTFQLAQNFKSICLFKRFSNENLFSSTTKLKLCQLLLLSIPLAFLIKIFFLKKKIR